MRWESRLTRRNRRSRWSKACRFLLMANACALAGSAADSVLPSLAYGPYCSSTVSLQNLADTAVDVELVAHRSSGALVPLTGHARKVVHLSAGERASYRLRSEEHTSELQSLRHLVCRLL